MRFPLRGVLAGFAVGAGAGWVAGLLRTPTTAPAGSSADEAMHLPQEEFGTPAEMEERDTPAEEHPPPRKAVPPVVKHHPGTAHPEEAGTGASEPATMPEATAEEQAPPKRRRAAKKKAVAPEPHADAAAALREGHAAATERLADAEATATPPPDAPDAPVRRRRRKPEA